MIVVPAHEQDLPIVLGLVGELLAELGEEGDEFAGTPAAKLLADASHALGSGRFLALLARGESDAPLGVLTLSVSFAVYAGGEYGVIDEMYVCPEARGQGIGRRLVEEALRVARDRGWFRLDVTAPEAARHRRVVEFYEKLGFEFTGPKLRLLVSDHSMAR
jgi:GNAT superfamily N-acetyltransferase